MAINSTQVAAVLTPRRVYCFYGVHARQEFFKYQHHSGMIRHDYHVEVSQWFLTSVGIAELILLLAFLAGIYKTFTCGPILVAHTITALAVELH